MNNVQTAGQRRPQTLGMVQVALFAALIIILAFTPFLGYIPLGFTRATIIHIPVIIGCLLLGPKKGAILGFVFGLTSLVNNTMNPTVTSFAFSPFYTLGDVHGGFGSVVICFIPRILTGILPYYVFHGLYKLTKKSRSGLLVSLGASGLAGALTNTLLVMNFIFLFFKDSYASANNIKTDAVYTFILTIIGINGVPEAIVAAILVALIGRVLLKSRIAQQV